MLKAAIFDLDGVLVDTVQLHFRAWKRMFSEYGKDFSFRDYKDKVDGILRIDGARNILSDLSEDKLLEASARKQAYFLEFIEKEGISVYGAAVGLIESLLKQKVRTAVISSSKNCTYILKKAGIDKLFEVAVSGNDVVSGKPDPEVFITAAKRLGADVDKCVVFEDAALGVESAKSGGFFTVGVDHYNDHCRLAAADLVVNSLSEVDYAQLAEIFKDR